MCEVVGKADFFMTWKNVCDRRNEKLQNLTFEKKKSPIYAQELLYWWRINRMLMLLMCG